jgi:type II secretory pathway pseudopilin PulG
MDVYSGIEFVIVVVLVSGIIALAVGTVVAFVRSRRDRR